MPRQALGCSPSPIRTVLLRTVLLRRLIVQLLHEMDDMETGNVAISSDSIVGVVLFYTSIPQQSSKRLLA
jgi:hypothetical protein